MMVVVLLLSEPQKLCGSAADHRLKLPCEKLTAYVLSQVCSVRIVIAGS
jgi:hypothetical protein